MDIISDVKASEFKKRERKSREILTDDEVLTLVKYHVKYALRTSSLLSTVLIFPFISVFVYSPSQKIKTERFIELSGEVRVIFFSNIIITTKNLCRTKRVFDKYIKIC